MSERQRVLYAMPAWYATAMAGGTQRTLMQVEALASAYEVDVVTLGFLADVHKKNLKGASRVFSVPHASVAKPVWESRLPSPLGRHVGSLRRMMMPRSGFYRPDALSRAEAEKIDLDRYDLIFGRYVRPLAVLGLGEGSLPAPVLIDIDDRDDLVLRMRLEQYGQRAAPLRRLVLSQIDALEKAYKGTVARADHLFLSNPQDSSDLEHASTSVLWNVPYYAIPKEPLGRAEGPPRVLFVGTGEYDVNMRGVRRFLRESWPRIRRERPDAVFEIVGRAWQPLAALAEEVGGTTITGFVEELGEAYARADVTIAPLVDGGGTKIKVLEGFAYGRPVVATPHTAAGYGAIFEGVIESAGLGAPFADAILRLLGDPKEAGSRARRGQAIIRERFSRESFSHHILHTCRKFLATA